MGLVNSIYFKKNTQRRKFWTISSQKIDEYSLNIE